MSHDPNYWEAPKQPLDEFREFHDGPPPTPGVWPWFVVYCVLTAVGGLIFCAMGAFLLLMPEEALRNNNRNTEDPVVMRIVGGVYGVIGLASGSVFLAAPFLPKRPWSWVYDLVLICLGMTNVCCLPVCIPLLIFWLKPGTKRFFGKTN